MVGMCKKIFYVITCDECKNTVSIEKSNRAYNYASATRCFHWSFSKDGKTVKCDKCRKHDLKDKYRYYR